MVFVLVVKIFGLGVIFPVDSELFGFFKVLEDFHSVFFTFLSFLRGFISLRVLLIGVVNRFNVIISDDFSHFLVGIFECDHMRILFLKVFAEKNSSELFIQKSQDGDYFE